MRLEERGSESRNEPRRRGGSGGEREAAITRALLAHYDATARALPWRGVDDPYAVWVSEVMLQQTRVEAVVPYYERWLETFPTVEALAEARLDEVLKAWEGLGYYRRARNLHAAARLVRERHGGRLPDDPADLRALPGVGIYTAGAVASIAFGVAAPAVDGNVRRVLSRLHDLEDPSPAELRDRAAELVPADRPGDFNQALMELGATICTPRAPDCEACPLAGHCEARARGVQEQRPRLGHRASIPERRFATAVVADPDGRLLLVRRPPDGLLGGLWEFPSAELEEGSSPHDVAPDAVRRTVHPPPAPSTDAGAGDGVRLRSLELELEDVRHTFSHFRAVYRPVGYAVAGGLDTAGDALWADPSRLEELALPVAQQRIAATAGRAVRQSVLRP